MLDTGASVSLINECTWHKLAQHTIKALSKWDGCQLAGVKEVLYHSMG